ncbi:MAG: hypothetical protein AB1757_16610 [Acidobacteriota bacterium]
MNVTEHDFSGDWQWRSPDGRCENRIHLEVVDGKLAGCWTIGGVNAQSVWETVDALLQDVQLQGDTLLFKPGQTAPSRMTLQFVNANKITLGVDVSSLPAEIDVNDADVQKSLNRHRIDLTKVK